MMLKKILMDGIVFLSLGQAQISYSLLFSQAPFCTMYTPDSILTLSEKPVPFLGGRFATCGDVQWFHNDYMATINLGGNSINTYKFDTKINPFQVIINKNEEYLCWPEKISFSRDENFAAISNYKNGAINIYSIDLNTHLINPIPVHILMHNPGIHGVRFSPKNDYLAFTVISKSGSIHVYKLVTHNLNDVSLVECFNMENKHFPLKPKSLSFASDEKMMAIIYCPNIGSGLSTIVDIHAFDNNTGEIGSDKIFTYNFLNIAAEDIIFLKNDSYIALSDQIGHKIVACSFNKENGVLAKPFVLLQNPEAQISFPHGIGASQDGKYLAVSNYGDDKFTIYAME